MTLQPVAAARIRAAWQDPTRTRGQAAAALGLTESALRYRARLLDVPAVRMKPGRPFMATDRDRFAALWRAGVRGGDIATALGLSRPSVTYLARHLGLPLRKGGGPRYISLAEYELREGMARSAAETRARQAADRRIDDARCGVTV